MTQSAFSYPAPQPPDELIKACTTKDCVLFVGAGLSAQAGYPTWQSFVQDLLHWAIGQHIIPPGTAQSYLSAIDQGDVDVVADGVVNSLGRGGGLLHHMQMVFSRPVSPSEVHQTLREIPFASVLTTNFDGLLEQTYQNETQVYTARDVEKLQNALSKAEFFILKLYGDLAVPETLLISPAQFEDASRENLPFANFMETLLMAKTFLFLGASLDGIDTYLKGIGLKKQSRPRPHFALVSVAEDGWQAKADLLKRRYGIEVLPYLIQPKHPEVLTFVKKLAQDVKHQQQTHHPQVDFKSRLHRIYLENIGPFEQLELELDSHWNILLGDNGVGKSTVLKAIALAFCGTDAQAYASRLLKFGKTSGHIILETSRNTYRTDLFLTSTGTVTLNSIPNRPLDTEWWLAIAFPPLRTMSWERPRGLEAITPSRPNVNDLLPLIQGVPDPRLDKLKQWLVNSDYLAKYEQTQAHKNNRYEKLLNDVFAVIAELTVGLTLGRGTINPETHEILIMTDDGELPLESISQGTLSLVGWVCVLLQRLHEIYDAEEDPKQQDAVVLIDEIDAHLHPHWQQSLLSQLSKFFPNVQFIATTHSPLIVGGLPPEQILRFCRNVDGQVQLTPIDAEMTVGRADQILTSDLFGLQSTLDAATQEHLQQYKTLLGKRRRTDEEETAFQQVREILATRIPMTAETPQERTAQSQARNELLQKVNSVQGD
jgi:recombinational DNA repair ATPase RecF